MDKLTSKIFDVKILGLAGLLALSSGCVDEKEMGGQYNRIVQMPKDCQTPINAGSSVAPKKQGVFYTTVATDFLACKDTDGNITIYRLHKDSNTWYSTKIVKPQ